MKQFRKAILIIFISLIVIGTVTFGVSKDLRAYVFQHWFYSNSLWNFNVKNFDANYESLKNIANFAYQNVNPEEENNFLSVGYDIEKKTWYLHSIQKGGIRLLLTKEEIECLNAINSCFVNKDSNWDLIRVDKTRVSFNIENGQYALVYSFDDSTPTYVNTPIENGCVFTKKICDNWYHVVLDPEKRDLIQERKNEQLG